MEPFERQFRRRKMNVEAVIAFVLGVFAAYFITQLLRTASGLFITIIVVAVGGIWYQIRRVI